jgi:hypothetical protein
MTKEKEVWNKTVDEMEYSELVDWAVGEIIFGLARGETIHNLVYKILSTFTNYNILQIKSIKG